MKIPCSLCSFENAQPMATRFPAPSQTTNLSWNQHTWTCCQGPPIPQSHTIYTPENYCKMSPENTTLFPKRNIYNLNHQFVGSKAINFQERFSDLPRDCLGIRSGMSHLLSRISRTVARQKLANLHTAINVCDLTTLACEFTPTVIVRKS